MIESTQTAEASLEFPFPRNLGLKCVGARGGADVYVITATAETQEDARASIREFAAELFRLADER